MILGIRLHQLTAVILGSVIFFKTGFSRHYIFSFSSSCSMRFSNFREHIDKKVLFLFWSSRSSSIFEEQSETMELLRTLELPDLDPVTFVQELRELNPLSLLLWQSSLSPNFSGLPGPVASCFCFVKRAELSITINWSVFGEPITDIFCFGLGGRGGAGSSSTSI